jgi:hypothetical protein
MHVFGDCRQYWFYKTFHVPRKTNMSILRAASPLDGLNRAIRNQTKKAPNNIISDLCS